VTLKVVLVTLPVLVVAVSSLVLTLVAYVCRCRRNRRKANQRAKLLTDGVVSLPFVSSAHPHQHQQQRPASSSASLSTSIHPARLTYDRQTDSSGRFISVTSLTSGWPLWLGWFTGKIRRQGTRGRTTLASFRNSGLVTSLIDATPLNGSRRRFAENGNYVESTLPSHTSGRLYGDIRRLSSIGTITKTDNLNESVADYLLGTIADHSCSNRSLVK